MRIIHLYFTTHNKPCYKFWPSVTCNPFSTPRDQILPSTSEAQWQLKYLHTKALSPSLGPSAGLVRIPAALVGAPHPRLVCIHQRGSGGSFHRREREVRGGEKRSRGVRRGPPRVRCESQILGGVGGEGGFTTLAEEGRNAMWKDKGYYQT